MLDLYTLEIDEENGGMDYIALVDYPAHMKNWHSFSKQEPVKQYFNEEKRIVTGVAIAVGLPIYRNSPDIGEHYVVFTRENTQKIWENMMRANYMHNVNEMHDSNKDVKGITYLHSMEIDRARGINPPNEFKDQNLQDGSIIVSYKVESPEIWSKIKNGTYAGFSIEGYFKRAKLKIKSEMSKEKEESLFESFKNWFATQKDSKDTKEKFGEAVTVDGVNIRWEGDAPQEGAELFIIAETEGGEITETLALEGDYAITNEDGSVAVIMVGEDGIITGIEVGEAEEEVVEEVEQSEESMNSEEILKKLNELASLFNSQKEKFEATEKANAELNEVLTELKEKFETVENENKENKEKFNQFAEAIIAELDKKDKTKFKKKTEKNWKEFSK